MVLCAKKVQKNALVQESTGTQWRASHHLKLAIGSEKLCCTVFAFLGIIVTVPVLVHHDIISFCDLNEFNLLDLSGGVQTTTEEREDKDAGEFYVRHCGSTFSAGWGRHGAQTAWQIQHHHHEYGEVVKPDVSHVYSQSNWASIQGSLSENEPSSTFSQHCRDRTLTTLTTPRGPVLNLSSNRSVKQPVLPHFSSFDALPESSWFRMGCLHSVEKYSGTILCGMVPGTTHLMVGLWYYSTACDITKMVLPLFEKITPWFGSCWYATMYVQRL